MADLIKSPQNPEEDKSKGITKSSSNPNAVKISGRSRLHSALAGAGAIADPEESFKAAAQAANAHSPDNQHDPLTAENRIAIMADCSGSMSEQAGADQWGSGGHGATKISLLQQALTGFINQVSFDTTSVAIYTFPMYKERWEDNHTDQDFTAGIGGGFTHGVKYKLSFDKTLLTFAAQSLRASGGTPMHSTMSKVINELPLTRGIIISDGDADNYELAIAQARAFAASETQVDCIHIGSSTGGEKLLQEVAKLTGGIYMKFDKVENFAKAFSFLTPEGRATLMLGGTIGQLSSETKQAIAKQLGAKEVK